MAVCRRKHPLLGLPSPFLLLIATGGADGTASLRGSTSMLSKLTIGRYVSCSLRLCSRSLLFMRQRSPRTTRTTDSLSPMRVFGQIRSLYVPIGR